MARYPSTMQEQQLGRHYSPARKYVRESVERWQGYPESQGKWRWPPGDDIQAYADAHGLSWGEVAQKLGQISLDRQAELYAALGEQR